MSDRDPVLLTAPCEGELLMPPRIKATARSQQIRIRGRWVEYRNVQCRSSVFSLLRDRTDLWRHRHNRIIARFSGRLWLNEQYRRFCFGRAA